MENETVPRPNKIKPGINHGSTQKVGSQWHSARLAHVRFLTLIDASSGYLNLIFYEKSSNLTTFSHPFERYRYV